TRGQHRACGPCRAHRAHGPAGPPSGGRITAPAAPAKPAASRLPSGNSAVVRVDLAGAAGDDIVDNHQNGGSQADKNGGDNRELDGGGAHIPAFSGIAEAGDPGAEECARISDFWVAGRIDSHCFSPYVSRVHIAPSSQNPSMTRTAG